MKNVSIWSGVEKYTPVPPRTTVLGVMRYANPARG